MTKIYDVSLLIEEKMVVYPGNPAPIIRRYASIPTNKTNESLIIVGSHTGTHVDSELHIQNDVSGADAIPLDHFYGACKVLDLTNIKNEIHQEDLEQYIINRGDIVLLKTYNSKIGYKHFRKDYVCLKLDAAEYLIKIGVKTLGYDYLSVKKIHADYEVHESLIKNLTLFEGLNLAEVPEGTYTFLGLPLRIKCDAAPARVVLISNPTDI